MSCTSNKYAANKYAVTQNLHTCTYLRHAFYASSMAFSYLNVYFWILNVNFEFISTGRMKKMAYLMVYRFWILHYMKGCNSNFMDGSFFNFTSKFIFDVLHVLFHIWLYIIILLHLICWFARWGSQVLPHLFFSIFTIHSYH